uniref:DUF8205 domain-containing protein n=1 Tax=Psilocybe cubensis TaxID=181762 RepID=A0A8H7XY12_PSICU
MDSSGATQLFFSAVHPERSSEFRATAPPKQVIKDGRREITMCCTNCGKFSTAEEEVKLKRCDVVSISIANSLIWLRISTSAQSHCIALGIAKGIIVIRPNHKIHCSPELGAGIQPLIKSVTGNPMLEFYIQVCLAIRFHLHDLRKLTAAERETCIRAPLLVHIDVGIEPTKIAQYMNLYTYPDEYDEDEMEGMLQLHDLVSPWPGIRERLRTLSDINIEVWKRARMSADEDGDQDRAVVLVEFVNDFKQSVTCAIVVGEEAIETVRRAEPFTMQSAITGKETKKPLSIASCFEYINTHIRSDHKNRLLLRAPMRNVDKELIRNLGRKVDSYATRALKVKMDREHVYIRHSAEFVAEHAMLRQRTIGEEHQIEGPPMNRNERRRLEREKKKEQKRKHK